MIRFRTALVLLACGWAGLAGVGGNATAEPQPRESFDFTRNPTMMYFVAKGDPGACGPNCSEWIAAEGAFDREAHTRLREFLDALPRKDLPIFFHSNGGLVGPSLAVGLILRKWRMKAGVGHTIPFGCRDTLNADAACRKLIQSGQEFKSRLRESGAVCASSCVYAFMGASTRTVAYVARVGIHRHRAVSPEERVHLGLDARMPASTSMIGDRLKQYVMQMGADFGLVDLAEQTEPASIHWLSRDDIARFGIATGARFETPWLKYTKPNVGYFVAKSVTRASRLNPAEYRTATVQFNCSFTLTGNIVAAVRRDLDSVEAQEGAAVRITSGDTVILDSERRSGSTTDVRAASAPPDLFAKAVASDGILLKELSETWSRETKFSTQGLSDALQYVPQDCRGKD